MTATQPVPHATLTITQFVVHLERWRNVLTKMMVTDLCSRFVPVLWVAMTMMTMVMGLIVPVMSKSFATNGFGSHWEWGNKIRIILWFFTFLRSFGSLHLYGFRQKWWFSCGIPIRLEVAHTFRTFQSKNTISNKSDREPRHQAVGH
jgi:hypothetical protein